MFHTDTSLHDLQDQLREDMRRARRHTLVMNVLAIAGGVAVVVLYWHFS